MDYSLPGSSVHEISQETLLEWIAISFSRGSSQLRDQTCDSVSPATQVHILLLSHLRRLRVHLAQLKIKDSMRWHSQINVLK